MWLGGLKQVVRTKLQQELSVGSIVVHDTHSQALLSLLDANTYPSLQEHIENPHRGPHPHKQAVYLLTPTLNNLLQIIKDATSQPPRYKAAHLRFLSALDDALLLHLAPIKHWLVSLREINMDFIPAEPNLFHFDTPALDTDNLQNYLDTVSDHLLTLLTSIGDAPLIKFYDHDYSKSSLSAHLAVRLHEKIEKFKVDEPAFPIKNPFGKNQRTCLILLDRLYDNISPLIHDLGYQCLVQELISVEGSKAV